METGPYGEDELLEALAYGRISANGSYREETVTEWHPLSDFAIRIAAGTQKPKPTRAHLVIGIAVVLIFFGVFFCWVIMKESPASIDWKKEEAAKRWLSDPTNRAYYRKWNRERAKQ